MRLPILAAIAMVACKNDIVLDETNVAPGVAIQTPEDGTVYADGATIELQGLVSDENGIDDINHFSWVSSLDGVIAEPPEIELDARGVTRWAGQLSVGSHTITLRATDAGNESAEDAVSIVVQVGAQNPIADISSPVDFDTFLGGANIDFFAVVGDPNQDPDTLGVIWTVRDQNTNVAVLTQNAVPGPTGATTARLTNASVGSFVATVTVTDADGNEGTDSVVFGVVDPDDEDSDGDGWSANQGDCDDNDADRFPGNEELCDLIDNDCNGVLDDRDEDNDQHIDINCGAYSGALPVDDCDDTNQQIHPAAPEIDDGIDNDCDGLVDDGTPAFDQDGDCYCIGPACTGSSNPQCATVEPGDCNDNDALLNPMDGDADGFSSCDGDCDDTDALLNPADVDGDGFSTCADDCDDDDPALKPSDVDGDGFSSCDGDCDDVPMNCGADCYPQNIAADDCDGFDQDCDGTIDEDASTVWYHDADGDGATSLTDVVFTCNDPDGAGNAWRGTPTAEDCDDNDASLNLDDDDGDGFSTCDLDCDDGVHTTYPGAPELCDGVDNNCVDGIDDSPDADNDGFEVCEGDCNDAVGSIYPGANDDPDPDYIDANCDGIDGDLATDVFVSAQTGSNANNGGPNDPLATIAAGIAAAGTTRNVLVATNQPYELGTGSLAVSNGVNVYGGYNSADWSRSAAKARVNTGVIGLTANSINSATTLAQLDVRASSNTSAGGTSYGARVLDSSGLRLVDTRIESRNGGAGTPGTSGVDGANGAIGTPANNGCDGCSGSGFGGIGGNGGGTCPDGGDGGRGGYGDSNGEAGDPGGGVAAGTGGTPGGKGSGSCLTFNCSRGSNGGPGGNVTVPGNAGSDGFGGSASGMLSGDFWFGSDGDDGLNGSCGSSGGGGGGGGGNDCCNDDRGGGGGAGGGAGQGGFGGGGGGGGGGSIALFLARSTINLDGVELVSGDGGNGGAGGEGGSAGDGASGLSGGAAADDASAGGSGGSGSDGGRGGHGGGGGGGISYGIYKVSSTRNLGPGGVIYNIGSGGAGGVAPIANRNGQPGNTGQEN